MHLFPYNLFLHTLYAYNVEFCVCLRLVIISLRQKYITGALINSDTNTHFNFLNEMSAFDHIYKVRECRRKNQIQHVIAFFSCYGNINKRLK